MSPNEEDDESLESSNSTSSNTQNFAQNRNQKFTKRPRSQEKTKKRSAGNVIEVPTKITQMEINNTSEHLPLSDVSNDLLGNKRGKALATLAFESYMTSTTNMYSMVYPDRPVNNSIKSKYQNNSRSQLPPLARSPIETRVPTIIITPPTPTLTPLQTYSTHTCKSPVLKGNERHIIDNIERNAYEKAVPQRLKDSIEKQLENAKELFERKKAKCSRESFYSKLSPTHPSRIHQTAVVDEEIVILPLETQHSLYDSESEKESGDDSKDSEESIPPPYTRKRQPKLREHKAVKHWSFVETEMFYIILKHCGPDFSYMREFLENRTYDQIHKKFLYEENYHPWRITQCFKDHFTV
ncbi:Homeodomain-like DNA binding domain-containing transcription factor [Phycomyces blakesleeanus NRRL 1555(-)]|uniref:Homeodomain-like DNA binding domain-containing transcription factor n=1 Tax=Phycomyces blakesleeanus (strain ATCC 8743b / DSM 1359 / FGSC 10004 / NBRC 33097 / NRRL 1555) TaxID=763407 RepID=A0A162N341_PHYB8|nr:Homeodomain-like DNA binding domain-containing transcription factor [Phycomyces blakesleeanus NRRL 1555(-)]OAD68028.1 Homeodomain-like DNA binding domain-containing transcription factor [Phycomyces blakesleeanus NRRL 1555(-)]|eukprot:XP_018286068.1 Homeodomain-like DNA binding domain-containing transcription factor [Phycomyces blakesleeanus NRRL 1555(-)]